MMSDGHLGGIKVAKIRIEFHHDKVQPVQWAPYCAGLKTKEFEEVEMNKMIEQNVVELAQTEWGAPAVFAPKKYGTLRFRVEYKRLDALTKLDSYHISHMDECIDA